MYIIIVLLSDKRLQQAIRRRAIADRRHVPRARSGKSADLTPSAATRQRSWVAQLLTDAGEEVLIVDRVAAEGLTAVGNVLDPGVLDAIDLDSLQAAILALDADTATLFATVILKDMAPDIPVIARVNLAENVDKIHAAGADFALSISQVSGMLLARRLLGQQAIEIDPLLKVMKVSANGLAGKRNSDMEIRERTGCSGVAVERGDKLLIELDSDFRFDAGDEIYVCGSSKATQRYSEVFPQA